MLNDRCELRGSNMYWRSWRWNGFGDIRSESASTSWWSDFGDFRYNDWGWFEHGFDVSHGRTAWWRIGIEVEVDINNIDDFGRPDGLAITHAGASGSITTWNTSAWTFPGSFRARCTLGGHL
jgi:hypothetical protein